VILAVVDGFSCGAILPAANGFAASTVPRRTPLLRTIGIVATVAPPIAATAVPAITIRRLTIPAFSLGADQCRRDLRLALSGP
jgi:hypothetical protein